MKEILYFSFIRYSLTQAKPSPIIVNGIQENSAVPLELSQVIIFTLDQRLLTGILKSYLIKSVHTGCPRVADTIYSLIYLNLFNKRSNAFS